MAEGTRMQKMDEAIHSLKEFTEGAINQQGRTIDELSKVVTSLVVKMETLATKQTTTQDSPDSSSTREVKYPYYYIEFLKRRETINLEYEERMAAINHKYEKLASVGIEIEVKESIDGKQNDEYSDGKLQIEADYKKEDRLSTENEKSSFHTQAFQDTAFGHAGGIAGNPSTLGNLCARGFHDLQQGFDGLQSVGICSVFVYSKYNKVDSAHHLFDKMPRKALYSWKAILNGYCEVGDDMVEDVENQSLKYDKAIMFEAVLIGGGARNFAFSAANRIFNDIPLKSFYKVNKKNEVRLNCACMAMTSFVDILSYETNLYGVGKIRLIVDLSTKARIPWRGQEEMVLDSMLVNFDQNVDSAMVQSVNEAAKVMIGDDAASHKAVGSIGASILQHLLTNTKQLSVQTNCNIGILATIGYGIVLGVICLLNIAGLFNRAYCTRTHPFKLGFRLTDFKLVLKSITDTIIAKFSTPLLMKDEHGNAVIVGANYVDANGDTANKTGTYNLTLCAMYHNIPFYVATQLISFDLLIPFGQKIIIDDKSAKELLHYHGGIEEQITAFGICDWNPIIGITPTSLMSAQVFDVNPLPLAILDRQTVKRGNQAAIKVLIQWANAYPEDATWEFLMDIQKKFPSFDP